MAESAGEKRNLDGSGKVGLGCLLVLLLGGAAVSGLFAFAGLASFLIDVTGSAPTEDFPGSANRGVNWFGTIVLLVFAIPMFVLFSRGVVLTIARLRGRETAPLVTVGLAAMLAFAYGLPAVVAGIALVIFAPERSSPVDLVWGVGGAALLIAAPFMLHRQQKNAKKQSDS